MRNVDRAIEETGECLEEELAECTDDIRDTVTSSVGYYEEHYDEHCPGKYIFIKMHSQIAVSSSFSVSPVS